MGTGSTLTIATYNMHAGRGTDGVFDLERQAADLAECDADVVCVQEVGHRTGRSGGVATGERLAELAGYPYIAFAPTMVYDGGWYGNALLARRPLTGPMPIPFVPVKCARSVHVDGKERAWPDRLEPRGALMATVHVGGVPVTVVSTHLSVFPEERASGARQLASILARADLAGPTIVGMDSNASDASAPERAELLAILTDAAAGTTAAYAATFPAPDPRFPIDLLLVRDLTVTECRVVPTAGTDHHALTATVQADGADDEDGLHVAVPTPVSAR